ncbi:MAG: transposase [Azoarcus sp.]|nr:transposase [Azoarcus sp.]
MMDAMNRPAVIDRATLPNAVEPLQDMVLEMAAQLDGLRAQFDAQMESLRHQLAELRRRLFGPRSEAIHAGQGELWSEAVEVPVPPEDYREVEAHRRRQPGRAAIGEHLPRRRVEHDLSADEKAAFAAVERIGEEVSEMLEYIPARLEVIQNVRLKYRCERADGSSTIRTATAQGSPIAKSNAGPGLLAHVMVSKYLDHCPLARQQRVLARDGVVIARQTLCDWVLDGAELLSVLMPVLHRHVLASPVIFTDDTTLALQAPGKTVTARMWAYLAGGHRKDEDGRWRAVAPAALYDFTLDRSGTHPRRILGDWRGYLQADDYSGNVAAEDMLPAERRRPPPDDRRSQLAHKFQGHRALESPHELHEGRRWRLRARSGWQVGDVDTGERLGLHLEIDLGVDMGRVQGDMPEPRPNRVDVHARPQ